MLSKLLLSLFLAYTVFASTEYFNIHENNDLPDFADPGLTDESATVAPAELKHATSTEQVPPSTEAVGLSLVETEMAKMWQEYHVVAQLHIAEAAMSLLSQQILVALALQMEIVKIAEFQAEMEKKKEKSETYARNLQTEYVEILQKLQTLANVGSD
jgi:hypothetical protein